VPVPRPDYQSDVCSRCTQVRPIREFFEPGADWGPGASRPVCRACRAEAKKLPAPIDFADDTPAKYRKALLAHMEAPPGTPFSEAVRAAGLPSHWGLGTLLDKSSDCRRIYRRLLEDAGMDLPFMLRKLGLQLHAMKPHWNKKSERFDFFPDTAAQGKALELLHKLWQLTGDEKESKRGSGNTIVFMTNVGGERPTPEKLREMVLEIPARAVAEGSHAGDD